MTNDELRTARDQVYGRRSTDNNWEHCREMWQKDSQWLIGAFNKLPRPLPDYESLLWPKIN